MEENIRKRLVEMNRLMSYDRSKTLLEQTNDYDLSNIVNQQQGYQDRFNNYNYNPIEKIINNNYDGDIDSYLKDLSISETILYKGKEKPTEPTVVRGEGYYLDKNGNTKYPNGYWYITYDSPRYKKFYKETIQPILDLNKDLKTGQVGMTPFTLLKGEYKEKVFEIYNQDLKEWKDRQPNPLEFLKDWTIHDWLETAELVTGVIGMIPIPPVALVGNLLSMGFGVTNAKIYADEGNNYDASIALAFALIPGPEVARLGKELSKPGKTIIKDGVQQLTDDGAKLIDDAVRANWKSALSQSIKLIYKKYGFEYFMNYMMLIYRRLPRMAQFYITIAGTPLTFEQLYYLWTLSLKPEEQLKEKEKIAMSQLKPVMDMLRRPDKFVLTCVTAFINWLRGEDVSVVKNINPEAVNNIEVVSPEKQDEILDSLLPDN